MAATKFRSDVVAPPVPGSGSGASLVVDVNVAARAKLPIAGTSAAAASRPFGAANAPTFTVDDVWTYGRTCGGCSVDGETPEEWLAATATRPVATAVIILVPASSIADFLPEWTTSGHDDVVGSVHISARNVIYITLGVWPRIAS
jgi:hypothetical protein